MCVCVCVCVCVCLSECYDMMCEREFVSVSVCLMCDSGCDVCCICESVCVV